MGILLGYAPTVPSVVRVGSPSRTTDTSVDVPPPSQVRIFGKPATFAMSAAPSAPAAGPDSTVVIGWWTTSSAESTPPLDFMIENGTPGVIVSSLWWMPATYRATLGFTAASTRVVMDRSYSRYSRSTSEEMET